ncbi:FtsX-like permease family protein [Candidatus Nitrospira neomarina]|uniref:FtsX-like permease family protein n=1 Tax=Candidatus Nitrospira neomarina TaxID=3020899 RepID=A0AA96GHW0_9BACT|nr:FtsX-like permease family protein [Candidatus Nitrospira neomarina]WNM61778.1 FtsX-like permease family protein [Candidatus Nitrospira neomarina]
MIRILLLLVLDHVRHRPFRAFLTVVGVAIGVSAWLAIRLANGAVYQSFEDSVVSVVGKASITLSRGSEGMDESIIEEIQRFSGVQSAQPVLKIESVIQEGPSTGLTLVIWGVDLLEYEEVRPSGDSTNAITDDQWKQVFSPKTVFLGEEFAGELGVTEGQTLTVTSQGNSHDLIVGGLLRSSDALLQGTKRQAIMDIAAAQWVFNWLGRLHSIAVVSDPGVSGATLIQALKTVVPPDIQINQSSRRTEQVESMLKAFQFNLTMLSAIALLVGVFLVYNTMAFSVAHHRREIGILRALGMERRAITGLFLLEAGLLGLVGGALGCWFGVFLAGGLTTLIGQSVGELYGVTSLAVSQVHPWLFAEAIVIGAGVSLLGALRPSWDASTIAPVQALSVGQSEDEETGSYRTSGWIAVIAFGGSAFLSTITPVDGIPVGGYAAAFCLLVGGTALGPVLCGLIHEWRRTWQSGRWGLLPSLAAEQISRNPGRTSVTMAAIVVGLAIMVGVGIMIQSFRHTVDIWIEQTMLADIIVAPVSWLGEQEVENDKPGLPLSLVKTVLSIPGVEAVDPYMETVGEVSGQTVSLVARDMALHAGRSQYLFVTGDSTPILKETIEGEGVIVSEVLAGRLGLAVGNHIDMKMPSGSHAFPVKGIFYDYATDGGKVVMDDKLFRRHWGEADATIFAVYLKAGQALPVVRRAIEQVLKNDIPIVTISNGELKTEILEIFDRTFRVTYVLELIALSVAVLGIINTLMTAITERRRELATLRALGVSGPQIQGLIFWESCYVAGLGAGLGILVGLALSVLLINVINKQSFGWTIQFTLPLETLGMALLVALLAAFLGAWGPARWASRQPIAEDLRYE